MSWAKVDDGFYDNLKILECSWEARGVWVTALSWVAKKLSDGRISKRAADLLQFPQSAIDELVEHGLWDKTDGGWELHDYLEYNLSKEEVVELRERGKQRAKSSYKRSCRAKSVSSPEECDSSRVPNPNPNPSLNSQSQSEEPERAGSQVHRFRKPVGDPPGDVPSAVSPELVVWKLYESVLGIRPGELGTIGAQYGACQTIADSAKASAGLDHGPKFEQAAERLLRAWLADPWVAEQRPALKHLASNIPKYIGCKPPRKAEREIAHPTHASWKEPDWMRSALRDEDAAAVRTLFAVPVREVAS